jgi:hypothetical protein
MASSNPNPPDDGDPQQGEVEQEPLVDPRPKLDPDELTPNDMRRARDRLGVNPYEYIASDADTEDRLTFIMWCIRSRTEPELTWEQADNTPFGMFAPGRGAGPDPQTARRTGRGSSPKKNDGRSSPRKPTG